MKLRNIIYHLRQHDNPASTAAADLLESLTPRPIEEAPKNNSKLLAFTNEKQPLMIYRGSLWGSLHHAPITETRESEVTHFIPLSAIRALMEGGE